MELLIVRTVFSINGFSFSINFKVVKCFVENNKINAIVMEGFCFSLPKYDTGIFKTQLYRLVSLFKILFLRIFVLNVEKICL